MDETLMNREIECVETKKTVVRCDGSGVPLGHPVIYLNLGKESKVICPYCSQSFIKERDYSTTDKKTKGLRRVEKNSA